MPDAAGDVTLITTPTGVQPLVLFAWKTCDCARTNKKSATIKANDFNGRVLYILVLLALSGVTMGGITVRLIQRMSPQGFIYKLYGENEKKVTRWSCLLLPNQF